MSDLSNDSNALWTKYALLLLASIGVAGAALLTCVVGMIVLAERKAPPIAQIPEPEMPKTRDFEDAPPMPMQAVEEKVRSTTPGVMLPLDQAVFLGTEAKGSRFCIIADASNSMKGAPLNHVKKEIGQTIAGLKPSSQFYIIFFNAADRPMPYPTWLDANAANIAKVKPWVQKMPPALYTWPKSSFDRAFKLQPKPDVIFFMTDGFIPAKEDTVNHIARLNAEEPRTIIHTILFTKAKVSEAKIAPAERQLRAIATKNDGTFRRVHQK